MAHFAEINTENIVTRVVVVDNNVIIVNGQESEQEGMIFLQGLYGGGTWIQTSYNGTIRKNYAGIGFTYDSDRDAFIPPRPFQSWTLNEETCLWVPPVEMPINENTYSWNEDTQQWEQLN